MATPSRFTRIKIATGYLMLLFVLFAALRLIHREVGNLSALDTEQILKADSLQILLKEKDRNTSDLLRSLNETGGKWLSVDELEEIISKQDTVITLQRVQHKAVVTTDSVAAPVRKKGFFRRLGEVFVPARDTAVIVNTTRELTTDTLLQEINPFDSLHQQIRAATEQKQEINRTAIRRNTYRIRRQDKALTARIDTLIKAYEEEVLSYARKEAENQQRIRRRSTRIIGGIAIGAVWLAAFFLILIWRDITRSNRYRKELEEANRHAEALLQAREKLMLAITHDFKAPLSSITGYIGLMSQLPVDNRQRFYLDSMKSASSHLLKLVNDLLDFHRLDRNKAEVNRTVFNPAQLFDEIHAGFRPLADAGNLSLHYHLSAGLNARYIGDPLRIRQIATNLLSNAVKFTASGGITLKVAYERPHLQLTVSDTGKGIAPEDRERIFQAFTRLAGAQGKEGSGLGLSIVAKLVHLLEGTIRVESTEGKGSAFFVSLPLFPAGGERKRPLRILLIDDDKLQLGLTSAMLERKGITAVCCEQPEELTGHLRREKFDFLLTDVQMPAINGFDLLASLRASDIGQARSIPVIAITARSEIKGEEFLRRGFAGYLNKPFTVSELLSVIGADEPVTATAPDFSALTAFPEGDEDAARDILESFIAETTKELDAFRSAYKSEDADRMIAIAHKLTPVFTLLHAHEAVSLFIRIESRWDRTFPDAFRSEVERLIETIGDIIDKAKERLN